MGNLGGVLSIIMANVQFEAIPRQIFVPLMFIAQVVFNVLSTSGVFAGTDQSELSDKYQTPITPAGYTFSVWGVIYFCQAVYVIYQALPAQRENKRLDSISPFVVLAFTLNCLWLLVFSYEYLWAAFFVIAGYLLSLLKVYMLLEPNYFESGNSVADVLCVWLAFSSNLAWVTVATLLNLTIALTQLFQVTSAEMVNDWCVGLILFAVSVSSYYTVLRVDPMYAAVSVWALIGIYNGPYNPPQSFAIAGAVAVVVLYTFGVLNMLVRRFSPSQPTVVIEDPDDSKA